MTTVPARLTTDDVALIHAIAERAATVADQLGTRQLPRVADSVAMVHTRIAALDLQRLHDASNLDFVHDIWGIDRHLNRKTARFVRAFSPRFTSHTGSEA